MPTVAHYLEAKAATERLVARLSAAELAQTCPSCPAWSIQDVVAHHVHMVGAYLDGTFSSSAHTAIVGADDHERAVAAKERDDWTTEGVEERRGCALREVLAEWDAQVARMDERSAGIVLDLAMHLGDIAEALGVDAPVSPALWDDNLLGWYHAFVVPRLAVAGESVQLVSIDTGSRWGSSGAAVSATSYELVRTIGGRRARAAADALVDWGATSEAVRRLLPVYGWPG